MKYQKVILYIEELIQKKELVSGSKLPSIRILAVELNCSKSTVLKAYETLEKNRIAYSIEKTGYFLLNDPEKLLISETIDFSSFKCDSNYLSFKDYQYALNNTISKDLKYISDEVEVEGLFTLRNVLKSDFKKNKIFTTIHDLIITSGAQQAFYLILNVLLENKGNILIENPCYENFLRTLKHKKFHKKVYTFLRTDESIDLNLLEYHFIKNKIKLFYITPEFYQPLGISIKLKDKIRILDLCYKHGVYLIEDNYLSDINAYDETQSFYALDKHDIVFHIKSYSRLFSKSIRLAALICPNRYTEEIVNFKAMIDLHLPVLDQAILSNFIISDDYKNKRVEVSNIYSRRLDLLTNQFENVNLKEGYKLHVQANGIFAFLEVPFHFNLQTMINEIRKNNIIIKSIKNNFFDEHHYKGIILSIASISKTEIVQASNLIIDYINNN